MEIVKKEGRGEKGGRRRKERGRGRKEGGRGRKEGGRGRKEGGRGRKGGGRRERKTPFSPPPIMTYDSSVWVYIHYRPHKLDDI